MHHQVHHSSPLFVCLNPLMILVIALAITAFACGDDPTYADGSTTQDGSPNPNNDDSNNTDGAPDDNTPEDNTPDVDEDSPLPTDNNTPAPSPDCGCETDQDCPAGFDCDNCECVPVPSTEECAEVCQERVANRETQGLCSFDVMQEESCEDICSDLQREFGADTQAAVETCIVNDPLCFSSLDDCIFGSLYPEGANVELRATASGFDEFEGLSVFAAINVGNEVFITGPVQITEGRWSATWEESLSLASEFNVYFFIDVDGDERCDAEADLANSGRVTRGSDYEAPAYSGDISNDDERSFAFVCDLFR